MIPIEVCHRCFGHGETLIGADVDVCQECGGYGYLLVFKVRIDWLPPIILNPRSMFVIDNIGDDGGSIVGYNGRP